MIQIWQRYCEQLPLAAAHIAVDQQDNFIPVGRKAVKPLGFWSRLVKEAASDLPDFVGIQMGQQ
jgi:hypothetical protein